MNSKRSFVRLRAQSAMEYLMTYGWAILIISVVLGALFSIGVFSGTSLLGTSCISSPGFYCTSMSYSHTTGNLIVTLGQNTGTSWAQVAFAYAPQGTAAGTGATAGVPNTILFGSIGAMSSGYSTSINLPVSAVNTIVGTSTSGSIWACYVLTGTITTAGTGACNSASTVYYVQMATLTAKAT